MTRTESKDKPYGVTRFLRDVVLLAVAAILMVASFGFSLLFGLGMNGSTVVKRGVAVARSCEFGGPFEVGSPGWWWRCQAHVTWQDGSAERREFTASQLTGDDIGREVDVVERRIAKGSGKGSNREVFRADFEAKPLWGQLITFSLMGGSGMIALTVIFGWWTFLKRSSLWNRD